MRLSPSKANGLVTTPTVRMPCSRRARAMTGAAPVPVPPPMPAVMNTMCEPISCSMISSSDSSAPARPMSGCAPAPNPSVTCTPSWMRRSALDWANACASVFATTKSTPSSLAAIMLLTALPPAPPTPKTVIRARNSFVSGALNLIDMVPLLGFALFCRHFTHHSPKRITFFFVESPEQPTGQPGQPPFRAPLSRQ